MKQIIYLLLFVAIFLIRILIECALNLASIITWIATFRKVKLYERFDIKRPFLNDIKGYIVIASILLIVLASWSGYHIYGQIQSSREFATYLQATLPNETQYLQDWKIDQISNTNLIQVTLNLNGGFDSLSREKKFDLMGKLHEGIDHEAFYLRQRYNYDVGYSQLVASTSKGQYVYDGSFTDSDGHNYQFDWETHPSYIQYVCGFGINGAYAICVQNVERDKCGQYMNKGLQYGSQLDSCIADINKATP